MPTTWTENTAIHVCKLSNKEIFPALAGVMLR